MKLGKRVQLVIKQNAGGSTHLLSSPARVMSVVVKRHGRVEGRESLKALVRVSMKLPSAVSMERSTTKAHRAECRPTTPFDVGCGHGNT